MKLNRKGWIEKWCRAGIGWFFLVSLFSCAVHASRIKDLTSVAGVRSNPLIGYGLVVGLDGTGDKNTPVLNQSFARMIMELGITLPPGIDPKSDNSAVVAVHSGLPAFAKLGQQIDVTVSSVGKAKSLRGGSLLMTPLKGADGHVYALAQGNLVVGGFGAEGADGSRISLNVPVVGNIPNGAIVERTVPSPFATGDAIVFNLNRPDFTTAMHMVDAINALLGPTSAKALDAMSIRVLAPRDQNDRVNFLAALENVEVTPAQESAKVVINARTGTIVIGENVHVNTTAVAHGNLSITVTESPKVSQPNSFSQGQTTVLPQSSINVNQEKAHMFLLSETVTLKDVVNAVNRVGMAPGDLVTILQTLKAAGALHAELVVI